MANKVQWGLSNVYIAARSVSSQGVISYGTPVALAGAVSLTLNTKGGEANPFYADNVIFYDGTGSIAGYDGELEVADIPDWFKTGFLGFVTDTVTSNLVETNKAGENFALMFQVEGDDAAKKYCIYNVGASLKSRSYATKEDNVQPQTNSLTIAISGETVSSKQVYIDEAKSGDTNYSTFFNSCALPTIA